MAELKELLASFGALEIALMAINVLFLIISKPLFNALSHGRIQEKPARNRLHVFRAINILIIALLVFYHLLLPISGASWVTKIVGVLFVIYLSYLGFYIANYFILSRFGRVREMEGKTRIGETYNTRALRILSAILFIVIGLIGSIQVLEFESLLQAGGVIGFIGVLLALTQSSWAPDIISGLIILNSDLMQEGDVIQLEGAENIVGMVYKTKMFHTEVLNLVNNHRVMIKNARLRDYMIHNLSKFASAKGLRETLAFKIGYDVPVDKVRQMFERVYDRAMSCDDVDFETQHPIEVRAMNAGDYAVEWQIFYFIKNVRHMLRTRQAMTELVLIQAEEDKIALATPVLHHED